MLYFVLLDCKYTEFESGQEVIFGQTGRKNAKKEAQPYFKLNSNY